MKDTIILLMSWGILIIFMPFLILYCLVAGGVWAIFTLLDWKPEKEKSDWEYF